MMSRRGLWSVAKKERDESAFVAEGEGGARTLRHELCARCGCVCARGVCWDRLGCRVAEKRKEREKCAVG